MGSQVYAFCWLEMITIYTGKIGYGMSIALAQSVLEDSKDGYPVFTSFNIHRIRGHHFRISICDYTRIFNSLRSSPLNGRVSIYLDDDYLRQSRVDYGMHRALLSFMSQSRLMGARVNLCVEDHTLIDPAYLSQANLLISPFYTRDFCSSWWDRLIDFGLCGEVHRCPGTGIKLDSGLNFPSRKLRKIVRNDTVNNR